MSAILEYLTTTPFSAADLKAVPAGGEGFALQALLAKGQQKHPLVVVLKDNDHLLKMREELLFYGIASAHLHLFPEWETIPYDRVSPSKKCMTERLVFLSHVAEHKITQNSVILTTIRNMVQYVVFPEAGKKSYISLQAGHQIAYDDMIRFLVEEGYARVDIVREMGEFAVRGDIIDFYLPTADHPCRVTFFGDEVESLRTFDPLDQCKIADIDHIAIYPASEILLTEENCRRFRTKYLQTFGVGSGNDLLVKTIENQHIYPGFEQWLPLFSETPSLFWERIKSPLFFVHQEAQAVLDVFFENVADHYTSRQEELAHVLKSKHDAGQDIYRPCPPEMLYAIKRPILQQCIEGGAGCLFGQGEGGNENASLHALPYLKVAKSNSLHKEKFIAFLEEVPKVLFTAPHARGCRQLKAYLEDAFNLEVQSLEKWAPYQKKKTGHYVVESPLQEGFSTPTGAVIPAAALGMKLSGRFSKNRAAKKKEFALDLNAFEKTDYLVHEAHGVGQFIDLVTLTIENTPHDFMLLHYANEDKLYVPVENMELLSRYGGSESGAILDRLGAAGWQKRHASAKKKIRDIAKDLFEVAAKRALIESPVLTYDAGAYDEFVKQFPFQETEDQLNAIHDVKQDLLDKRPMDRLLCGDVGFGKTEVALRAAFMAAMSGLQVAMIVPTTLLCRQHFHTFSARLAPFNIKVCQLSRLVTRNAEKEVVEGLKSGEVNVVIATHSLLKKKVEFAHLGLAIIDEEQHFGVVQKERLKSMATGVNILSMSATPIPRTLQLSLTGVRDLSLIATPPMDRLAVKPFIMGFDQMIIKEAILREYHRGGQVYFVCPRISDLEEMKRRLQKIVPHISVEVAYGQMPPKELDTLIENFYEKKFTILLTTNIVESGLDVPNANTLIVHRAHLFGLAQLYQLKGRVGRGKTRGYAYFMVPPQTLQNAKVMRRLDIIKSLDKLGGGFSLASHDMDLRGSGNLVGEAQSGHVKEVGVELYQNMLSEAIADLKAGEQGGDVKDHAHFSPEISLGAAILIPESYIHDLSLRLSLYRRLAHMTDEDALQAIEEEMKDRFGSIPDEVHNLLKTVKLKILCKHLNIAKIDVGPKGVAFTFFQNHPPAPAKLLNFVHVNPGLLKITQNQRLVYLRNWDIL